MTAANPIAVSHQALSPPRAEGSIILSVGAGGRLHRLRQSASLKALFPRTDRSAVETVLVNTAGGATGGDRFGVDVSVEGGAHLIVTTQAAERAYRAQPDDVASVRNRLFVGAGSRMHWLPQEMILFDGSALDRTLSVELAPDAEFLLTETLVLGRAAMGETVRDLHLRDRIEVRRNGASLFLDQLRVEGDAATHFARPTLGDRAGVISLLLMVSPRAEALLEPLRARLPKTGGASLLRPDCLVARLLAPDSFMMRRTLVPMLRHVVGDVPKPWKI